MRTIHKYSLTRESRQFIQLPINAEILSAKEQNNWIVLYAMVDTGQKVTKDRTLDIYGTGWDIGYDNKKYIDTVMMPDGLVFHVFEILD